MFSARSKLSRQTDKMEFQDDLEARRKPCDGTDTSLDQLIDRKLIELQTHAALITSTLLSRPEYSSGHSNMDIAESAHSDSD